MASVKVVIRGDSMWPTFRDGDEVEFTNLGEDELQVGNLVVAIHPLKSGIRVVKRIVGKVFSLYEHLLDVDQSL